LGGEVRNVSLLVAIGVNDEGFRKVLAVAEGSKEDKASWTAFLGHLRTPTQRHPAVCFRQVFGTGGEPWQHDVLNAVWVGIARKKVSWVLDADIRDFFGSISHEWMVEFLRHRIADDWMTRSDSNFG
jgi:hypothetical protein